ncbi:MULTISPECIES: restriction endonuclease subunit S [unclassified Corynebacterium]|uniref:restriction endonuclease subunit S n=1 Tax=unclassified Corynebacterium TaxID=2624378 RepID=UPI000AFC978B|nr:MULTISPECIES: restriction endonuclease subunit S [unclassified Corynebacterium]MBC6757906.1 hypothetical protein [Corynebacterium sp. LK24]
MARTKSLPLIEDFDSIPDEALVPKEEQPYPIPKHWKWVRLGSVCKVNPSRDNISSVSVETDVTFVPMAAVSDVTGQIEHPDVRKLQQVAKGYTSFQTGDVLFAKITPCMENGKAAIVPGLLNGLGYGSTEFFVLRPLPALNSRFLHAFVRQHTFRAQAKEVMAGAVGQQRVPKWFLEQFPFPLPPLEKQLGIIEKLTENLQKVDKAVDRIEVFLEGADRRTESLLEAAIQGQLTEEWRNQRGVRREDWTTRRLGDLGSWGGGGTPKKSVAEYWLNGTIRWVTPKDMKGWEIERTQDQVSVSGVENSTAKLYQGPAICIVVRSGILRRILPSAMISGEFTVNQDMKVLHSVDESVNIEFVHCYLMAREAQIRSRASKSGTTVESIDFKKLTNLTIDLPTREEQDCIVTILNDLLMSSNQVSEQVRQVFGSLMESRNRLVSAALAGRFSMDETSV